MQTATTTSPPSPQPTETPERKSLRESLNIQRRAGLMLVRDAEKRLKELDEADRMKTHDERRAERRAKMDGAKE